MNNEIKQHISEFLDDELDSPAALSLLKQAMSNPEIGATLNRYTAISQAIKNERIFWDDQSFCQQVSERLKQEPVYLLPQRTKPDTIQRKHKVLAVAASAALVAVLSSQTVMKAVTPPTDNTGFAVAELSANETQMKTQAKDDETTPLNERISDYLQAHNNGIYTSGDPDYKPLVKVTAYSSNR